MFISSTYSFVLAALLLLPATSTALAADSSILPVPQQVSKHVYAWIGPHEGPNVKNKGYRMNMGFVIGDDAVAMLETGYYPKMAEAMVAHIRDITDKPIKYAINTNSQPDRFFGNAVFKKLGAQILAHPKEIQRMEENASNYMAMIENTMKFKEGDIAEPVLPDYLIEKNTSIDLGGGVTLNIDFHKAAHTPSPLIVYIPRDNVVYAGDILYSGRILAIVPGGNIKQWLETFAYLKKYKNATFVPGHGKPAALEGFSKSTFDYLTMLDNHMSQRVDEGVEMQDAINKLDQSAFSYLKNFEQLSGRNANRAFQEAENAAF